MSSVGILSWRSALSDGEPIDVPDFSKESSRRKVANDHWSPWPDGSGDGKAPHSILGKQTPTAKRLEAAQKVHGRHPLTSRIPRKGRESGAEGVEADRIQRRVGAASARAVTEIPT